MVNTISLRPLPPLHPPSTPPSVPSASTRESQSEQLNNRSEQLNNRKMNNRVSALRPPPSASTLQPPRMPVTDTRARPHAFGQVGSAMGAATGTRRGRELTTTEPSERLVVKGGARQDQCWTRPGTMREGRGQGAGPSTGPGASHLIDIFIQSTAGTVSSGEGESGPDADQARTRHGPGVQELN